MRLRARTVGLGAYRQSLKRYPEITMKAVERALFQEAEETITDAKEDTPVDTGALRASGFVELPRKQGSRVGVQLGFGGVAGSGNRGETNSTDVGYAVIQHQDCSLNHLKRQPGGGLAAVGRCKYLDIHVRQAKRRLPRRIAREVHAATRRTIGR